MRTLLITAVLAITATLFLAMSCRRENNGDALPTYLGRGLILNPPDTFRIMFRLNEYGNVKADLQFEDSAVWHIKRDAGQFATTWIQRNYPDSIAIRTIVDTLQIGLEGDVLFQVMARHSYGTHRNVFLTFHRQPFDFETYPNRL